MIPTRSPAALNRGYTNSCYLLKTWWRFSVFSRNRENYTVFVVNKIIYNKVYHLYTTFYIGNGSNLLVPSTLKITPFWWTEERASRRGNCSPYISQHMHFTRVRPCCKKSRRTEHKIFCPCKSLVLAIFTIDLNRSSFNFLLGIFN